jgi:hypothetical protein
MSRSQWSCGLRRESAAAHLLGLCVRIPPGAWMAVSFECCVLSEVSASGWFLVQRSPTDCGVSECDRETSKGVTISRRWARAPKERKKERFNGESLQVDALLKCVLCQTHLNAWIRCYSQPRKLCKQWAFTRVKFRHCFTLCTLGLIKQEDMKSGLLYQRLGAVYWITVLWSRETSVAIL